MKVRQLIARLQRLDPELPVCFDADDDTPRYVGSIRLTTLGGHERLDDLESGGMVSIARVKKHKAVVLKPEFWGELIESGAVKWLPVNEAELDTPTLYRTLRAASEKRGQSKD